MACAPVLTRWLCSVAVFGCTGAFASDTVAAGFAGAVAAVWAKALNGRIAMAVAANSAEIRVMVFVLNAGGGVRLLPVGDNKARQV